MEQSEMILLAYGLIAVSLLLLVAEVFVPSGIVLTLAVLTVVTGLGLMFFAHPSLGMITMVGLFIAIPLVGKVLLQVWPKTAAGRRFFLSLPDRKSTRLNSSHIQKSRMPSSA